MITINFQVSLKDRVLTYCNEDKLVYDTTKDYIVDRTRPKSGSNDQEAQKILDDLETDQVAWVWVLIFAYAAPEIIGVFLRSLRMVLLKTFQIPPLSEFVFVLVMETLHVIGLVFLAFLALPQLDTTHAVLLTNCLAVVPGLLLFMSRSKRDR